MSQPYEETNCMKAAESSEGSDSPRTQMDHTPGRMFLRQATIEATAHDAAPARTGSRSASAEAITGDLKFDRTAILCGYACAVPDSTGNTVLTLTKNFTNTLTLSKTSVTGVSLSFKFDVKAGDTTFGTGTTFSQEVSNQVQNGVSLRQTQSTRISTQMKPGRTTLDVDDTRLFGLLNPKMRFVKAGPSFELTFKFIGGSTFNGPAWGIRDNLYGGLLTEDAAQQLLALYPPLQDPTGSTLVAPRFKKTKDLITVQSGQQSLTFETVQGTSSSQLVTTKLSAEITEKIGFKDTIPGSKPETVLNTEFAVGQKFQLSLSSEQRMTSERVTSLTAVFGDNTGVPKCWRRYKDKLFKNHIFVLETSAAMGHIQGVVRDRAGAPIPNATVTATDPLTGDRFITQADASGNYRMPILNPKNGSLYPVTSCGQTQSVRMSNNVAAATIAGGALDQSNLIIQEPSE